MPSNWTIDTLKEYLLDKLNERDSRYQQRFDSQEANILTATTAQEKRLDLLNELRVGVATKEQFEASEKSISSLAERVTRIESQAIGSHLTAGKVYAAIGAAVAILGAIVILANNVIK